MGGGLFGTFGFLGIQEQVGVNCRILLLLALVVMLSPQRRTEVAFPVLIFCGAIRFCLRPQALAALGARFHYS